MAASKASPLPKQAGSSGPIPAPAKPSILSFFAKRPRSPSPPGSTSRPSRPNPALARSAPPPPVILPVEPDPLDDDAEYDDELDADHDELELLVTTCDEEPGGPAVSDTTNGTLGMFMFP